MVVCTEVYYMLDGFESFLPEVYRILAPGGRFAISTRPRYFYLAHCCQTGNFETLRHVSTSRGGRVGSDNVPLNWCGAEEFRRELEAAGFTGVERHGIGCLSGISGDPNDNLAQPGSLNENDRQLLLETELHHAGEYPETSRYILYLCRRER